MRKIFFAVFVLLSLHGTAQSTKDVLVGASVDVIKTDIQKLFNKAQFGIEGHYFIVRHFAVGAGAEVWTNNNQVSFMMGARYYASENLFIRFRGLIGANDAAVGVGWSHPIKDSFRVEGMGDFYLASTQFAVRVGVGYIIKAK